MLQGARPPQICKRTPNQHSKRRWPISRGAMANLHVPSTAAVCNTRYGRHEAKVAARGAPGDPQTRFAFSFVDESSRHSIPVGLDLAAFGARCMFCGDAGQVRPYGAITLLATHHSKVTAKQIAWAPSEHFANLDVHMDEGAEMQYGDSQRFATSSVLQFVMYCTRCTACVLTQQFRMDLPLATVVRGLFTGGSLGWYPLSSPASPPPPRCWEGNTSA